MKVAGIDVGNIATKVVILENGRILHQGVSVVAEEARVAAENAMSQALQSVGFPLKDLEYIVSTGAGGKDVSFANAYKTAVVCLARGARQIRASVKTVIDVGAEPAPAAASPTNRQPKAGKR